MKNSEVRKVHSGMRIDLGPDIAQQMNLKQGDFVILKIEEIDSRRSLRVIPAAIVERES